MKPLFKNLKKTEFVKPLFWEDKNFGERLAKGLKNPKKFLSL